MNSMHKSKTQAPAKVLTPFDWFQPLEAEATPRRAAKSRRTGAAAAPQTAASRTARILAHRWGSPYSRAGWP
ncbi:hypothetical protein [Ramlibacter rhizophilus]|uniref:Uncharacterized protein n=1 Tax=Ramlibacter rhizophilus TaxID=1781167 RepID=A0A4Z0BIP2_9BURK|nr:hypothetical protein [Ramlibacter rhizophilus]TFY98601.1 hypothetical protein EZ242_13795 [Ramlibacter rhizophilus]